MSPDAETDVGLIAGVDPAIEIVAGWFDDHAATIHRYAARRLGEHEAWDITADTFQIAIERFADYDGRRGHERAWLYGIASNLLRRHWRTEERRLRARARSAGSEVVAGDPLLAVDARIDAERDIERVITAISALEPDDRELLVLVAWERLSSTDAARALGIPAGTVRSRLNRIRTELRHHRPDQGGST